MTDLHTLAYVTLFAPLAAAAIITVFTQRSKALSGFIGIAGIVAGLVASALMAKEVMGGGVAPAPHEIIWLDGGSVVLKFGVVVDALSVLMSLIVGIVGTAVFVYSTGYMKGDEGYSRYFACLSLFAFSMLGIVFSTNLAQTFIFWELVGVSSYSLISYYYGKDSAVDAGKKAFLTNRIGDFGMTVGILLLFYTLVDLEGFAATLSFHELIPLYENGLAEAGGTTLGIAALLIFTGAAAKSAQVPLHVWLPDAMEGPTPVSALMHAATMVAAGVYLLARTFFLYAPYTFALEIVAWMGGITALLAALLAFVQFDVKKVLAYSTLSQLGYMVLAVGVGAPAVAMFHLMTHAFFKGLLFLGAGSVIHGCHHEQDMRQMGGLRKSMPITWITFWVGSLALAGIAPFAGFWSKDALLGATSVAAHDGTVAGAGILYWMGLSVAFMTACYMGRACWMTFHGEYRGHAKPHESPLSMTGPLMALALLAAVSGFFNLPSFDQDHASFGWLESLLVGTDGASGPVRNTVGAFKAESIHWPVAIGGTIAAVLGLLTAAMFHLWKKWDIDAFATKVAPFRKLLENKYYFDDFYGFLVGTVQQGIANLCAGFEKHVLIQGLVNGFAALHQWLGGQVRLLLDGHLHRYVTMAMVGTVIVLSYLWLGA